MKKTDIIRALPLLLILSAGWVVCSLTLFIAKVNMRMSTEAVRTGMMGTRNAPGEIFGILFIVATVIVLTNICVRKNRSKKQE